MLGRILFKDKRQVEKGKGGSGMMGEFSPFLPKDSGGGERKGRLVLGSLLLPCHDAGVIREKRAVLRT